MSGAGKYLKEKNPKIRVIAGDPVGSLYTHYHRTRTMGDGPPVQGGGHRRRQDPHHGLVRLDRRVPAGRPTRRRSRWRAGSRGRKGILLGGSAGLNVALALDLARELDDPDALIVTILCDTGERYLSKQFNDAWMQENQMLDTPADHRPGAARAAAGRRARPVVSVAPAAAVRQALNLMSTWGVSQIPVLENGQSVGGLIEGTLMTRALAQPALLDRPVSEVMDPPFPEVEAGTATDRVGAMLTRESPAALVRQDGKLVGIVSRYDVLQQLIGTR